MCTSCVPNCSLSYNRDFWTVIVCECMCVCVHVCVSSWQNVVLETELWQEERLYKTWT